EVRRKNYALLHTLAVEGAVERWIERKIPSADLLVGDHANLPRPGINGKFAGLVADFLREAETNRPIPFFGNAHAGPDVIANPLDAEAAPFVGKDVEANLKPVVEPMGDFDGFVKGVIGREQAIFHSFWTIDREVAVELDHGVVRLDGFVGIDLNLI